MIEHVKPRKEHNLETPEEASERRLSDRACKAKKRALETPEEASDRRSSDTACKAKKIALETPEEASKCILSNKASQAKKRALESCEETQVRRKKDRLCKRARKVSTISVEGAIDSFLAKAKCGPDYVCTCCHRLTNNCVLQ